MARDLMHIDIISESQMADSLYQSYKHNNNNLITVVARS